MPKMNVGEGFFRGSIMQKYLATVILGGCVGCGYCSNIDHAKYYSKELKLSCELAVTHYKMENYWQILKSMGVPLEERFSNTVEGVEASGPWKDRVKTALDILRPAEPWTSVIAHLFHLFKESKSLTSTIALLCLENIVDYANKTILYAGELLDDKYGRLTSE